MRVQDETQRQAAEETLKEVMHKLEEALTLARRQEEEHMTRERCQSGADV